MTHSERRQTSTQSPAPQSSGTNHGFEGWRTKPSQGFGSSTSGATTTDTPSVGASAVSQDTALNEALLPSTKMLGSSTGQMGLGILSPTSYPPR